MQSCEGREQSPPDTPATLDILNIKLQKEIHISSGFSDNQGGNNMYSIDYNSLYLLGFS